jgi:four helix bundle protein
VNIAQLEELEIWQEAKRLVVHVYGIVKETVESGHDDRFYTQLATATMSIMLNIAEGFSCISGRDSLLPFLRAKGSCTEVQNLFSVALHKQMITTTTFHELSTQIEKVAKLLSVLVTNLLRIPAQEPIDLQSDQPRAFSLFLRVLQLPPRIS